MSRSLERNLRLFPVHEALAGSMVYLPIFVLFTRENFGVSGAIEIASLTYFFIVALEVPSGWTSDWLGRVPTLSAAATGFVIGQACFFFGDGSYLIVVIGQFFVSAGYAFLSGTDVSFHFDTLESLGRAHEYADRQARIAALSYGVRGATAVLGGALGLIDLRLAFLVAMFVSAAQLVVTRLFLEPPSATHAEPFVRQVTECLRYLRSRFMGWIFFYGIALVVLEHVAFTLMQPWLTSALGKSPDELGATPILSGVVFAVVALVGAVAARASAPVAAKIGTIAALVVIGVVSAAIVTAMALSFSLIVLVAIAFRSVQGAAAPVLISAAVSPRTAQHHRATLLSINSLAGRLTYGTLLLVLSIDKTDDPLPFLQVTSVISWALIVVLAATGWWVSRSEARSAASR